ncbi:MAG: hypothetical protein ABIH38_03845 [Patescibacteria group bacterium]
MRKVLITLTVMIFIVFAHAAYGQSVASGDTLIIYLDPGNPGDQINFGRLNWPAEFSEQMRLVKAGQAEFICEVATDTTVWHDNRTVKNDTRRQRRDMKDDGGEASARFQSGLAILKHAGYEGKVNSRFVRSDRCYIKIWPVQTKVENPIITVPLPAEKDTVVIYHKMRPLVRRCFSDLEVGAGLSTSPYNGVVTLNLEAQFNRRTYLEATFGHSAGIFSKDRAVPGLGERLTDDHLFALRLIRYCPASHVGLHLGGMRLENVIRDGPNGQQHIRCYQALLVGPSFRFGKLTAHLSFAYGSDDRSGEDIKWTPHFIGEINLFPWR